MSGPQIEIRAFNTETDLPAMRRIWREVGWVDESEAKHVDQFISTGSCVVATMDGEAECGVHTCSGSIRLQSVDLPLCAVTAVTTSRIARGQAFAKRLTASQLQAAADDGAAVAALGMFDQGFYDLVGFGSGGYDNTFAFDPATLKVNHRVPPPRRLTIDDYQAIHQSMVQRKKVHGSVVLDPPEMMAAELKWADKGFGLGYFDGGDLTHFMWLSDMGEHGPYRIEHMAYRSTEQLIELLGLLKSLSDQVYLIKMVEPAEIQLQDLLDRPFRNRFKSVNSKYEVSHRGMAWWQLRVLNVSKCVAAMQCVGELLAFNLVVTDPVTEHLDKQTGWIGEGGEYIVNLGATSSAVVGQQNQLPRLECSINAFTRMLFGVASASSLAISDDLQGSPELLANLDRALRMPTPFTGWDF